MKTQPQAEFSISSGGGKDAVLNREKVRQMARRASQLDVAGLDLPEEDFLEGLLLLGQAAGRFGWSEEDLEKAIEEGRILAVDDGSGRPRVPAFQTEIDIEFLASVVPPVTECLQPVCASPKTLWLWFLSPKDELGGHSPVTWMLQEKDGEQVRLAAKRDAARLAAG